MRAVISIDRFDAFDNREVVRRREFDCLSGAEGTVAQTMIRDFIYFVVKRLSTACCLAISDCTPWRAKAIILAS
jgi:hypothetical protein